MKTKTVAWIELALIALLSGAIITQCISLKNTKPVVRNPEAPGESTLTYTPPPAPKFQLDLIKQIAELREFVTPKIDKIADDIYLARGYALGSVHMIVTSDGLVIIDTTESPDAARTILKEFRKITDKPVKYIIYTHGHLDHVLGAGVFMEKDTQIIGTADLVKFMNKDLVQLRDFQLRSRWNQAGRAEPDYALPLPVESPVKFGDKIPDIVWPTVTFDKEYKFELGGKKFELYHTSGETPDHLMVWMPAEKALFCGDIYYMSFPNLSSPMIEPRPVRGWFESLELMRKFNAVYLIPSHTKAVAGAPEVAEVLEYHEKAVRFVYDETIKRINEGKTVDEAVAEIKLPPELASRFHLQEYYGRVDWSVRGIYQGETGWYDGHGTNLAPLPPRHKAGEMIKLAGGADKILARAIELQKAGEHQLVCELCDEVLDANPNDKLAHLIKASSLDYLGYTSSNLNMFGFYRSAAAMERKAAGEQ